MRTGRLLVSTLFLTFVFLLLACSGLGNPGERGPVESQDLQPAPGSGAASPNREAISPSEFFLFITPNGVWWLDEPHSTVRQVHKGHLLGPQDLTLMPAPQGTESGGHAAFIASESALTGLSLHILSLPNLFSQAIPLVATAYEPGENFGPDEPGYEAVRALLEADSIAWSPDGQKIAFMAVLDGPSSDLYVYDLANQSSGPAQDWITRLTAGPGQAIKPAWSPDGTQIVYLAVENLGQGDGYNIRGVFAARADGSRVQELYVPVESRDETLIGWLDPATFLVHSWTPACGRDRLRAYNLETGDSWMIWEAAFNGAAFDPGSQTLLISVDQFTGACSGTSTGLFRVDPHDPSSREVVLEEETFLPVWDARVGMFFARTASRVAAIQPDGTQWELQAPEPILPTSAANGMLAWASPITGIWIAHQDGPAIQVTDQPAFVPSWNPAGSRIYFFTEQGLMTAGAPDFQAELIQAGVLSGGAFWVGE